MKTIAIADLRMLLIQLMRDKRPGSELATADALGDALVILANAAGGVLSGLRAKREVGRVGTEALKPTHYELTLREILEPVTPAASAPIPPPYKPEQVTPLTAMAEPLLDDPMYGPALHEAARVNRLAGLGHGEPPVNVDIITIALARMADEIVKTRKNQGIPPELAEGLDEYGKHWRAPFGRTPNDRDSDLDRHAGEQLMSVWRRVKSGEIPRPFDVQHPSYLKVIRERDEARETLGKTLSDLATAKDALRIIPPESPKPEADRRADSRELLKLAGHTTGLAGLERAGYGLRAGDRGVSLHALAADALSYAMHRLIETGEHGVRDAVILLEQIRHEHMGERQAAKPLRFMDRMYDVRMGMREPSDDPAAARLVYAPLDTDAARTEARAWFLTGVDLAKERGGDIVLGGELERVFAKSWDEDRAKRAPTFHADVLTYTMHHFEADARDRVGSMLGIGPKPMWTKVADALKAARTELAAYVRDNINPDHARTEAADWFAAGTEWTLDQIPNADRRAVRGKREVTFASQWAQHISKDGVPISDWDAKWERVKGYKNLPSVAAKQQPEHPPELVALVDKLLEPMRKHAAELEARIDEEVRQRAPVAHAELDLKAGADPVTMARHNLDVRACAFGTTISRHPIAGHEKARSRLEESAFALAVAVLASLSASTTTRPWSPPARHAPRWRSSRLPTIATPTTMIRRRCST